MSEMNHESDRLQPRNAYEGLQDAGLVDEAGNLDKSHFIAAAAYRTEDREALYEQYEDSELLSMVVLMDPRDPEEFELQQEMMAIWKKRVRERHEDL